MKLLILIRGLPGSGKSTLARKLDSGTHSVHYEADMFFTYAATDEYRFDPTRIKEAHKWCMDSARGAMEFMTPTIIVSNTFTRKWEMDAYLKMAEQHGYKVQIITCQGDFGNVHGVSPEKVEQMRERFEL